MLDSRAARHPPCDITPDKERYVQRQEHPYEACHASSRGGRITTQNREDGGHDSAHDGTQNQADPQRDKPANEDADPARSQPSSLAHAASSKERVTNIL